MSAIDAAAPWVLLGNWTLFSLLAGFNHIRVRSLRRRLGIAGEQPGIHDPRSMYGLLWEGLGFALAFVFARFSLMEVPWRCAASVSLGCLSVVLLFLSLRHLGLEWRIKAVVTEDHRLVTTGPYSVIRHPVFAALLALLLSTVALLTPGVAALAAIAACVYGTEIRIRAEDGLLERRFGDPYREYRSRVAAYLPFVR